MESERTEVYERIPWETLETKQRDKKWIIYAVAGAITVGALTYSFARSQPAAVVPAEAQPAVTASSVITNTPVVPPVTSVDPVVVSEADLFAVDVDSFKQVAATHAEWAAIEYFGTDGSSTLLPSGLPQPVVPDGTSVFVDWVGATSVQEIDQLNYSVTVVVRSLVSSEEGLFVRQPTQQAVFEIAIDEVGGPFVLSPPQVDPLSTEGLPSMNLVEPPLELSSAVEAKYGPVVGGLQREDGSWRFVVISTGIDGVQRPVLVQP